MAKRVLKNEGWWPQRSVLFCMLAPVAILHRLWPKDLQSLRKFAQKNLQVKRFEQAHWWLRIMWGLVRARPHGFACRRNRLIEGLGNRVGRPLDCVPKGCIQNCWRIHGLIATGRSSFHGSDGLSYSGRSRFQRGWCNKELVLLRRLDHLCFFSRGCNSLNDAPELLSRNNRYIKISLY